MSALFLVALLSQTPPPPETPTTITSVEVRLPAGDGADEKLLSRVPGLVSVRRGQLLSRRAVQRSVENLFATGHFSDIIVEAAEGPGGLALTFELVPRRSVAEVYVEGNRTLTSPEALAATRLERSSEFWPERIEQAAQSLAELYRRRGYRAAQVTTRVDSNEGGVAVGFLVDEGTPTRVASITLAGDPQLPLERILEILQVGTGDVLDQTALEAAAERLRAAFRGARYYRARVDSPQSDAQGRVVVPITAGPRYEVLFSGNHAVSSHALSAVLAYGGEETLDSGLAQRLAERVARFYRFHGFHDVLVTPSEVTRGQGTEAALRFAVDEGQPLRVVELAFVGNTRVSSGELREVLARVVEASAPTTSVEVHPETDPTELTGRVAKVVAADFPEPPWDTVLDEFAWAEATKAMTALYRERGFLKASVRLDHLELAHGQGRARFAVEEGPQATFRELTVKGLPEGFRSDALEVLRTSRPAFSTDVLEKLRLDMVHELGRKGYLFANLQTSWGLDATARFVDCAVAADAGPQVKVRAILPVGNVRTADDVLLQQAQMVEGEPLDVDSLFRTQSNLIGLGIFRTVDVEMLSPERPEALKTVVLKVRERPRYSSEVSFGYFLADGPRVVVDLGASDLGGRAVNLTGHFQVNFVQLSAPVLTHQLDLSAAEDAWQQIGGRANVSIGSRSLLPANVGVRVDGVLERVFRPQFLFNRAAVVPTIDWTTPFEIPRVDWLHPKLSLALQYELEWSSVNHGNSLISDIPTSFIDQERLRFRFGEFLLQTVRFSPTIDLRDNSLNPHKGLLLQGSGEVTGALSAYDDAKPTPNKVVVNFLKVSGLGTVYFPLGKSLVLAISARAGQIVPLAPDSSTPPVRRFFLGGATSMRGFNEDQLIAEDTREQYQGELQACRVLAVKDGCTAAARAILQGRQVPSQGGEFFELLKVELRFPAFSVFDFGIFAEAGNLWLKVPTTFGPFRYVAGIGVRYVTPIGPLALDLGVNLAPDTLINEPTYVVHFNIGVF